MYVCMFRFRTGLSEPVPFLNWFIGTGFILGNRFKVNKRNINKRSKIKYFWESCFQNCFFNKTGSKMEPVPIKNPVLEPVYETGLPALVKCVFGFRFDLI